MGSQQDMNIALTIMAIREELMLYFKGTCVDKLVGNAGIHVDYDSGGGGFYYQRRLAENERKATLSLRGIPLFKLQQAPEKVIFLSSTLKRSAQFRRIESEIDEFLRTYLQGVEIEKQEGVVYAS